MSFVQAVPRWLVWSAAYFALQLGAPMLTLPSGWLLLGGVLLTTLLLMASLLHLVFAWAHEAERVRWLAPAMLVGGLAAWLGWLVSERTDYLGAAAIAQAKQHGVARKLMGVRLLERGVPREGYPVLVDGAPVSTLTSGVYSPTLEQGIGMAYLPTEYAKTGTPCAVEIRGKAVPAVVSTRRFLKGG